jgi:hypothetical protein
MDVEAQIAGLSRRVTALAKTAKGQERGLRLTELREGVALLRRYAISFQYNNWKNMLDVSRSCRAVFSRMIESYRDRQTEAFAKGAHIRAFSAFEQ